MLKDKVELPKIEVTVGSDTPVNMEYSDSVSPWQECDIVTKYKMLDAEQQQKICNEFTELMGWVIETSSGSAPTGGYVMNGEQYRQYLKAKIIIALGKFF
jgi:hypothetical protein